VTLSLTGLRNAQTLDFLRYVQDYTLGDDAEMGVMNIPVVQDERVTQNELNIIASERPSNSKSTTTSSGCATSRASWWHQPYRPFTRRNKWQLLTLTCR
jgi:hypothetical protein